MKFHPWIARATCAAWCLVAPLPLFAQTDQPQPDADAIDAELRALEAAAYDEPDTNPPDTDAPNTAPGTHPLTAAIQSMNPDISLILDLAAAWFSGDVDLGGGHDPQRIGFNLQGLELAISADVDPYFRLDAHINFGLEGVEIEEAYATTLAMPWQLQARAGQFNTAFGRHNPKHLHAWTFTTQPLMNTRFLGHDGLRGLGVELSRLAMWVPGTFRWYISAQNLSTHTHGHDDHDLNDDHDTDDDHDDSPGSLKDLLLSARVEEFIALSDNWDLLLGLSYATTRTPPATHLGAAAYRQEIWAADTLLNWRQRTGGGQRGVGWQTEFMLRRHHTPAATLHDFGLSSWLEWRIDRRWASALRAEYLSPIEARAHDHFAALSPDWAHPRQRAALQLSHYPSHFSRLRLEYNLDHTPARDTDNAPWTHILLLQAEFVIGAHGAHNY